MLAKVVDNITKICSVAIGSDIEYYEKHGYTELDVEQAWDGNYYLKGYAPIQPVDEQLAELDAQYNTDKAVLMSQYTEAVIDNDSELVASIKEELAILREEYDTAYEEIVGGAE
jgi:hypothetical protein